MSVDEERLERIGWPRTLAELPNYFAQAHGLSTFEAELTVLIGCLAHVTETNTSDLSARAGFCVTDAHVVALHEHSVVTMLPDGTVHPCPIREPDFSVSHYAGVVSNGGKRLRDYDPDFRPGKFDTG